MTSAYTPHNNPENRARLLYLLKSRHTGQGQSAKKSELLTEMWGADATADKSYNNQYDRSLRAMIEELVQGGEPICSSPTAGYWYAASLEDGLPAAEQSRARAMTQLSNANRLTENIKKAYGGQLAMFGGQQ